MMNPRPCERKCKVCGYWKHHSRFRSRQRKTPHGIMWHFDPVCKDCQQKERNEIKNADRPLALIRQRAATAAHKAGSTVEFFMTQMNYQSLVPMMRAFLSNDATCVCCGHSFVGESDVQIEHVQPPRHDQDWARLHTRNIRLACRSCNNGKGKMPYLQWLDDEEGRRLSNLVTPLKESPNVKGQGSFDF
jgi:hypothetical protein